MCILVGLFKITCTGCQLLAEERDTLAVAIVVKGPISSCSPAVNCSVKMTLCLSMCFYWDSKGD